MKALVLSGGGSLGSFQVGAIQALAERGESFDLFVGISVGAINAAHMAMYRNTREAARELADLWAPLQTSDVHKRWFPFGYLHALWQLGARNTTPLCELVDRRLKPDQIQKSGKRLCVGAVAVETSEYRVFDETDPDIAEAVIASSALPIFLEARHIDGLTWVDGGARNATPLRDAIVRGATDITVVTTFNDTPPRAATPSNIIGVGLGTLAAMLYEIMQNDLKHCQHVNELIDAGHAKQYSQYKKINTRLIQPSGALHGDAMEWIPATTEANRALGFEAAEAAIA